MDIDRRDKAANIITVDHKAEANMATDHKAEANMAAVRKAEVNMATVHKAARVVHRAQDLMVIVHHRADQDRVDGTMPVVASVVVSTRIRMMTIVRIMAPVHRAASLRRPEQRCLMS